MSIAKHSLELRLKAVKHYLSGKDGQRQTASLFGVGRTALRRWVIAYQYHGIDGLTWKNDKYPTDFKKLLWRSLMIIFRYVKPRAI